MTVVLPQPATVRRNPTQKRSQARITSLLDSAARLVDEAGVHNVSTTEVARGAASSVGVIYRYFPNVNSLVDALTVRNVRTLNDRLTVALDDAPCTWDEAARAILEQLGDLMHQEPGFRVIGLGDNHHGGPSRDSLNRVYLARALAVRLHPAYPTLAFDDLVFQVDVAIEIAYGLLRRAYAEDGTARDRLIETATSTVLGMAPKA